MLQHANIGQPRHHATASSIICVALRQFKVEEGLDPLDLLPAGAGSLLQNEGFDPSIPTFYKSHLLSSLTCVVKCRSQPGVPCKVISGIQELEVVSRSKLHTPSLPRQVAFFILGAPKAPIEMLTLTAPCFFKRALSAADTPDCKTTAAVLTSTT